MVSHTLLVSVCALLFGGSTEAKAVPVIDIRTPEQAPQPPSYCNDVNQLLPVLRSNKLQSFCKEYIEYEPGDARKVTETVTVTTCANANLRCTPTTVTPVISITTILTNTISIQGEPVTDYTTITPSITIETTLSQTVGTFTSTYTIGTPQGGLNKRHYEPNVPSCVSKCIPSKISSACSSLVVPVSTITKTLTVQGRVETITAEPSTATITQTATTTSTIPGETTTFTITEATQTATVTRTEDITVTVTSSVCPSRTQGIIGIGISYIGPNTGEYVGPAANSELECCQACYSDRGCFGWLWSGTCTYVHSIQQSQDPNVACPASLGLLLPAGGNGVGGRGPCFGQ